MLIAFGIDKDTVQHSTPLKQIQRCNSLCRVLTSVPLVTNQLANGPTRQRQLADDMMSLYGVVVTQ